VGSFSGSGRYVGRLHRINAIAVDSGGNLYIGEIEQSERVRKSMLVIADWPGYLGGT